MQMRPYPLELRLVCTWLLIIPPCAFFAVVSSASFSHLFGHLHWLFRLLYWLLRPFVPIDATTAFFFYGGVLAILGPLARTHLWAGLFFFTVPLLALIIILRGDWAMQKIGIPPTSIKLLANLGFLLGLNVLLHMALFLTLNPFIIFAPFPFRP